MKKVDSKKNNNGKKKKTLAILTVLLLILALAGTYAWTSYTDWVRNHMQSLGYDAGDVTIVEEFDGGKQPIVPGGTIVKKVNVINASPVASFVRLSFEEQLHKLGDLAKTGNKGDAIKSRTYDPATKHYPVVIDGKAYTDGGSGWTKTTAKLRVDGQAATVDGPLQLYVKGAESVLFNIVEIDVSWFPKNFRFDSEVFPIPVLEGDIKELGTTPGAKVKVAQKVTAFTKRNVSADTYEIVSSGEPEERLLSYYTYSDKVEDSVLEADWAGEKQWVQAGAKGLPANPADLFVTAAAPLSIKSLVDPELTFGLQADSVVVGSGKDFAFTDAMKGNKPVWFFNIDDGYFYYTKPVDAGTQTSVPVMSNVKFPENGAYNLAAYDLHVGSEAIPAQRSMLAAASLGGKVEGNYENDKLTVKAGGGFGLATNTKLYEFLANQSKVEEADTDSKTEDTTPAQSSSSETQDTGEGER